MEAHNERFGSGNASWKARLLAFAVSAALVGVLAATGAFVYAKPGNGAGPPQCQYEPPGHQYGTAPGAQYGVPPGHQYGGPPGQQYGGPPGHQDNGPPGQQYGPPGHQYGGPPGCRFGPQK